MRNPSLSLRRGDFTAGVRMDAVNFEKINEYFDLLKEVSQEYGFLSIQKQYTIWTKRVCLWNPVLPKLSPREGKRKLDTRRQAKKQQITVIGCGSATGHVIPPFIVFAAKNLNHLWMKNEVPGTCFAVSNNGWVDYELFSFFSPNISWLMLYHFVHYVYCCYWMGIALILNLPERIK